MRRSKKFAIYYMVCYLLAIPGYQFDLNKVNEWRIETAVKDYALKECGIKLKEIDVDVEFMRLPGPFVVGKDWIGKSDPDIGDLRGRLQNQTISFYGACEKKGNFIRGTKFILEGTHFVSTDGPSDYMNERNPGRIILFLSLIGVGAFGWIFLRRREEREDRSNPS